MRRITEESIAAFLSGKPFRKANMCVNVSDGLTTLNLHGNMIARKHGRTMEITVAGWNTPTTRSRLNGLPGVSVYNRKHQLYLNGQLWDGNWIAICLTMRDLHFGTL